MYASVDFQTCAGVKLAPRSMSLHPFRRRLGLLSSTLASIADSLVAEGPSDLICNQVTLHRRDLLDASSSSCRKICLFLLEECSFPAAVNDSSHRFPFVVFHQAERN